MRREAAMWSTRLKSQTSRSNPGIIQEDSVPSPSARALFALHEASFGTPPSVRLTCWIRNRIGCTVPRTAAASRTAIVPLAFGRISFRRNHALVEFRLGQFECSAGDGRTRSFRRKVCRTASHLGFESEVIFVALGPIGLVWWGPASLACGVAGGIHRVRIGWPSMLHLAAWLRLLPSWPGSTPNDPPISTNGPCVKPMRRARTCPLTSELLTPLECKRFVPMT